MTPSLSVIVPTKDEEGSISKVIIDIERQRLGRFEVLVVDNSEDKTGERVKELMRKYSNLRLIEQRDTGKGNAMRLGVIESKGKIISFLDGDDTYPPRYLHRMLELLRKHDVVIASRLLRKEGSFDSPSNFLLYRLLPFFLRSFYKDFKTSEPTSGMRMMRKSTWNRMNLKEKGFVIEMEMEVQMAKNRMSVAEIPIPCVERRCGKSKFILNLRTMWRIRKYVKANAKYLNRLDVKSY
jgi:dolichol-phosphate mannosyltransferase